MLSLHGNSVPAPEMMTLTMLKMILTRTMTVTALKMILTRTVMARGVSNRRNARQGVTKVVTNVRITICDSHNSLPDPGGGLVLEEVFYRSRSIFFFIWVHLFRCPGQLYN